MFFARRCAQNRRFSLAACVDARNQIYITISSQEKNPEQKIFYFYMEKIDFENLKSKNFEIFFSRFQKNRKFEIFIFQIDFSKKKVEKNLEKYFLRSFVFSKMFSSW